MAASVGPEAAATAGRALLLLTFPEPWQHLQTQPLDLKAFTKPLEKVSVTTGPVPMEFLTELQWRRGAAAALLSSPDKGAPPLVALEGLRDLASRLEGLAARVGGDFPLKASWSSPLSGRGASRMHTTTNLYQELAMQGAAGGSTCALLTSACICALGNRSINLEVYSAYAAGLRQYAYAQLNELISPSGPVATATGSSTAGSNTAGSSTAAGTAATITPAPPSSSHLPATNPSSGPQCTQNTQYSQYSQYGTWPNTAAAAAAAAPAGLQEWQGGSPAAAYPSAAAGPTAGGAATGGPSGAAATVATGGGVEAAVDRTAIGVAAACVATLRQAAGVYVHLAETVVPMCGSGVAGGSAKDRPTEATSVSAHQAMAQLCLAEVQAVAAARSAMRGDAPTTLAALHAGCCSLFQSVVKYAQEAADSTATAGGTAELLIRLAKASRRLHAGRAYVCMARAQAQQMELGLSEASCLQANAELSEATKEVRSRDAPAAWKIIIKDEQAAVVELEHAVRKDRLKVTYQVLPDVAPDALVGSKVLVSPLQYVPQPVYPPAPSPQANRAPCIIM